MRRHHKPVAIDPQAIDVASSDLDPAEVTEVAHRTAAAVVSRGRAAEDPEVTARLVDLVREIGLSTVAQMWADRPARSLPGALWRLYLLHEWVQRRPEELARAFTAGAAHTEVNRVITGVAEPPDPQGLRSLTSSILAGVFDGDLALALERASAFCHVVAVGLSEPGAEEVPLERVRRAGKLQETAIDLAACARLWRHGELT